MSDKSDDNELVCLTCGTRPSMVGPSTICIVCDRDEWRDATLNANKRFEYSENLLKSIHREVGKYLEDNDLTINYPCNYEEIIEVFKELNESGG
jgi:hypothetical protein